MNATPVRSDVSRLDALDRYEVLDFAPDPAIDEMVQLAAMACNAPVAAVSFLGSDRIFVYSRFGLRERELALGVLPCEETILADGVYEIGDTRLHAGFSPNGIVLSGRPYRFYAGAPIATPEGVRIG